MTWLYVLLLVIVAAAVPTTVWLKRAGDREWQKAGVRVLTVSLVVDTERFAEGMRQAALAADRLRAEMKLARGPLEQMGRELDERLERIRRIVRESIAKAIEDEKGHE